MNRGGAEEQAGAVFVSWGLAGGSQPGGTTTSRGSAEPRAIEELEATEELKEANLPMLGWLAC